MLFYKLYGFKWDPVLGENDSYISCVRKLEKIISYKTIMQIMNKNDVYHDSFKPIGYWLRDSGNDKPVPVPRD
jgi:hypothetical protein